MGLASSKYDKAIEDYYALRPFRYPTMVQMKLSYTQTYVFEPPMLQLDLEMCGNFDAPLPRFILQFVDVHKLRFNPTFGTLIRLTQLEIRSIHGRQWENLHFSVHEVEHNTLEFLCKDFSAVVVNE